MRVDSLLAGLEARAAATPATPCDMKGYQEKPASLLTCTPATLETPKNDNAGNPARIGCATAIRTAETMVGTPRRERGCRKFPAPLRPA